MKNINNEYEIGKGEVANYIAAMDKRCEEYREEIRIYENSYSEETNLGESFNYYEALKFVRTWDIIKNDLDAVSRNLVIAMQASDMNYIKCLEWFNGAGQSIKNTATLRVMVCNARKKIRIIYEQKYGVEE